jgi:NitT/TauT family transport system permease protein
MVTRLRRLVPPLAFGLGFLALWQLVVVAFNLKPYFLPKPTSIFSRFFDNIDQVWKVSRVTGTNALIGLILGTLLGLAAAFVASRFRLVGKLVTPMAVAVSAMPIIVLVSVMNNMFSITSELPRRFMVAIVTFFIVFINVAKGLSQASATHLELMNSYGASSNATIRKVRLPNALGFLFVALKQAAPLAVITSFVAEYFGGRQNGLGYRIGSSVNADITSGWAYVLGASLLGLSFYVIALVLERYLAPWQRRPAS